MSGTLMRVDAFRVDDSCSPVRRPNRESTFNSRPYGVTPLGLPSALGSRGDPTGALNSTLAWSRVPRGAVQPSISEALELSNMMMMGEPGIPKNTATILRSYASQISAAEGWAGDPR